MMEPEIVKNRGLSRVSDGKVRDDVIHSDPWVRWTDLEEAAPFLPAGARAGSLVFSLKMRVFGSQRAWKAPP